MATALFLVIALLWHGVLSMNMSNANIIPGSNLTTRSIRPRALSGTFSATTSSSYYNGYIYWSATQDTSALTSTITAKFYLEKVVASSYRTYNLESPPYSITIGGTTTSGTQSFDFAAGCAVGTQITIGTASKTVSHSSDGSISAVSISGTFTCGTSIKTVTVSGSASITAITVTMTVKFNANGGSTSTTSKTVTYGSTYGTLPTPTRTGYGFNGWYTAKSSGTKVTASTKVSKTSTHTLYAQWSVNSYTISFVTNGGSACNSITQNYGTTVTLPSTSKTGYTFNYWCSDSGLTTKYTGTTMPAKATTLYAKFTINPYTISFVTNGGSTCNSITQNYGTTVTLPSTTKTGYAFNYWCSDSGLTTKYTGTTMPAGSITLYAKWTANQYTVTYNGNGGTASATSKTVTYDNTYGDLATATRTGYGFKGWYTALSGGNVITSSTTVTMAYAHTIYAQWTANQYTVTYNGNGGTASATSKTVTYGNAYGDLATATRTGYGFKGWYTASSGGTVITASTTMTTASSHTIYAQWNTDTYTITYNGNGGSPSTTTRTVAYASTYGDPPTVTRTGYNLKGWYTASSGGTVVTSSMSMTTAYDHILYAQWTAIQYTISFESNGGSTCNSITQDYGTTVTLPSPTRDNYIFSYWCSDSGLTTEYTGTTMPAGSITLYAKWVVNQYTISFVTNGGSTCNSITQDYGTTVTLPSTTKTGYAFDYWCSDSGLTTKYTGTTMPAKSIILYAKWTPIQYTISFVTNGGSTCNSITQNYGTTVTLPSTSKTGYTFNYWCSDSGLTTKYTGTTMPAGSITLYAKFTINPYTISFVTNGGSTCNSITQNYGTTVTLPSTSKTGYTFNYWCSDSGLTTKYTETTMPAKATTLYAKFTINSYTISFVTNGGNTCNSIAQNYGTTVTLPTPTKTGYAFDYWCSDSGLTTKYTGTTMPAGSITLYAKFTINPYTISFVTNGGNTCNSITQNYGTTVTLPSTAKTGYTFNYWCSDSGLTTKYTGTKMPAGSITLYAKFTINPYTISFVTNGGSTCNSITQNYGTTVTLPTASKTGHTFDYWCSDSGLTTKYTETTMPAGSITLYAKFTVDSYNVLFKSDGNIIVSSKVNYMGTITYPENPSKTGYTFNGWDSSVTTVYTQDITINALWVANKYFITIEDDDGKVLIMGTFDYGTELSFPSTSKAGYTSIFTTEEGEILTTVPAYDVSLRVEFVIITYTMTFAYESGVVITSCIQVYGSNINYPNAEKKGYRLAGWRTNENVVNTTTVPAADTTFYAIFAPNTYKTMIIYSGDKSIAKEFKCGDVIDLTSLGNEVLNGYEVLGWYMDANFTDKIESNSITVPAYNIELYPYVISNRVEIVFDTKDLSEKDVESIIKEYTDAEFVIESFEDQGEITVIIRFNDVEEAKEFVRIVSSIDRNGNNNYLVSRVSFINGEYGSSSTILVPFSIVTTILSLYSIF